MAQLRFSPRVGSYSRPSSGREFANTSISFPSLKCPKFQFPSLKCRKFKLPCAGGRLDNALGLTRLAADPLFFIKSDIEVYAAFVFAMVIYDGMILRVPNPGRKELYSMLSTVIAGRIANPFIVWILPPTVPSARIGVHSFMHKGVILAAVGFIVAHIAPVLACMAIKFFDRTFKMPKNPIWRVVYAITWVIHMGFSSNLRYHIFNGIEAFLIGKTNCPYVVMLLLRFFNNFLGGLSFLFFGSVGYCFFDSIAAGFG